MIIKKIKDEITYQEKTTNYVFEINGKPVKVVHWFKDSREGDYDWNTDIDELDAKLLTEDERDELDEYIWEILDMKKDEIWDTEKGETK